MCKKTKRTARKRRGKTAPSAESTEDARRKIDVLALIRALENHVINGGEMTSTQVSAALALLKKTLPDMREPIGGDEEEALSHEDALAALDET